MKIDKDQPEGRYSVRDIDHNYWMMVEREHGKLVYWTTPGVIKDLSEFKNEVEIIDKLSHNSMIRHPKFILEWGDGNLIDYRIESSSRSHFINLTQGLYKPIYDKLNDIKSKKSS